MTSLFWILIILIPEGSGLFLGRELSYLFILGFPLLGLLSDLLLRKKIAIPVTISLFWVGFLTLSFFSTIQSSSPETTYKVLFYNVSIFLTFIYFFNHQDLKELFIQILIGLGLFFCFYTSIIYLGLNTLGYSPLPIPLNGYQFVFSRFGSHNHLGDLLVLVVIPVFFYFRQYKKTVLLIIGSLFMLFILGSYSRSAYVSLLVVLICYLIWQRKNISRFFFYSLFALVFLLSTLIFIVVKDVSQMPIAGDAHRLIRNLGVQDKELSAKRFEFLNQSIQGIVSRPLFGYGPDSFLSVSAQFTSYGTRTHSAHNIFLDTAVEFGLPALMFFLVVLGLVLKNEKKHPSFISLMILAFIVNSLLDYTYRIYGFMFIFIILAGLNYKEKGTYLNYKQLVALTILSSVLIIYPLYNM